MLEKEYKYFDLNRAKIIKGHIGDFVVIKDRNILAYFPDEIEAIQETTKNHNLGTFLVKKCAKSDEEIQKYHSRVAF